MLTVLKLLRSIWSNLNGDATPPACGAAVLIGCLLGLTPLGVQTVLLACLLLVFRVPVSLALVTCAGFKALDLLAVHQLAEGLGAWMLEEGAVTREAVVALAQLPVVGLVPFGTHQVTGGVALGLLVGLALAPAVAVGVNAYRRSLKERVTASTMYRRMEKLNRIFGGALKGGSFGGRLS